MRTRRWVGAGLALVAAAAVAGWLVHARSAKPGGGQGQDARAPRPVPVISANAIRRDVPIWLEGLGTVTANKTVTVKTQVDGVLVSVPFREGQVVRVGDLLAQVDPRPFQIQLQTAQGALERDQAQLHNANLNVERDKPLVEKKLIAPQQYDTDVATAKQLEGAVRIDEAAIQSARLNLEYARITSPIDGVTGVRLVDPGNVVHASDQTGIVIVTQIDPIAVLFTLPQDDLPRISAAMAQGRLEVRAYSRDGSTLLSTGQLELVDNLINQATATLRLKAMFPNSQRTLWPNQFVKARLLVATRRNALVVPASALMRGPQGTFVYVIGKDDTVAPRPVQAQAPDGSVAIIEGGLAEGESVVVDGQNQLRPGARVAARPPPKGPEEARVEGADR